MQWIPRQTPLYIGKSEGCRAIHFYLISAIKIVGTRSNCLSEAVTEAFRTCTHNDLRRNKKGIKMFPLKILFGKMQCIWIDMFSLWGKSGVRYFLISALKHRLWVLVRTDTSLRRFERVPTINGLTRNKKKIKQNHLKIFIIFKLKKYNVFWIGVFSLWISLFTYVHSSIKYMIYTTGPTTYSSNCLNHTYTHTHTRTHAHTHTRTHTHTHTLRLWRLVIQERPNQLHHHDP